MLPFEPRTNAPSSLPTLQPEAARRSARLRSLIHGKIKLWGGAIPFSKFMELALYAPGLGYYRAGTQRFGAEGDFVTAPELSPLFSRCVAAQLAEILDNLDGGDVLEMGAGAGTMAAELLTALEVCNCLPRRYLILETSPELRARQQTRLRESVPHLLGRLTWLTTLPDPHFSGVVIANELLDAMPACRFRVERRGISEWFVVSQNGGFKWKRGAPQTPKLETTVNHLLEALPVRLSMGYVSEVSLEHGPWVHALANILKDGVILLFDYGYPRSEYYHPQREAGTLACYYRHRVHDDPFLNPGEQDISVHVDFTALAEAAAEAGLRIEGYTTQAHFLLNTGLTGILAGIDDASRYRELSQQVKRLTLPGEMGEAVKVMALTKGYGRCLSGFSSNDRRGRL